MAFCFQHLDLVRQSQVKELVGGVDEVCTPIAKGAHTKVVPAAPLAVDIVVVIIVQLCYAMPGIPVEGSGYVFFSGEVFDIGIPVMPAAGAVHVGGNGGNIFDDARFFPGFELEVVGFRVTLVTHLCYQFRVFLSGFHHQLHFVKSAGHGFFYKHVFAQSHRHHGNREVRMIGYTHGNRFYLAAHFIEHGTEILETRYIGKLFQYGLCMGGAHIHIAKSNELGQAGFGKRHHIGTTLVTNAHTGQFYFLPHSKIAGGFGDDGRNRSSGRQHCGLLQKRTTRFLRGFHGTSN